MFHGKASQHHPSVIQPGLAELHSSCRHPTRPFTTGIHKSCCTARNQAKDPRPLGVEKQEGGKVEQTSVEESDLNSSFCTPFTFTDRHRTHTHTLASVPDLTKPSLLGAKLHLTITVSWHAYAHTWCIKVRTLEVIFEKEEAVEDSFLTNQYPMEHMRTYEPDGMPY
ncbi:unnamed protein product [Leuciscus chuanchicus]